MNTTFVKSPEPVKRAHERRAILTIAVGTSLQWLFDITIPTMRAYAERCGADLIVADDNWRNNEHPCYMKQIINSLWWRYDRVLYLDADIEIMPDAPNIFEVVPADKLGMYNEAGLYTNRQARMQAYIEAYNALVSEPIGLDLYDGTYYNAGMFLCSKDTNPHRPPVDGIMRVATSGNYDNTYVNAMIAKHQIPVHQLDWRWNRLITANEEAGTTDMREGAYFVHYASDRAKDMLRHCHQQQQKAVDMTISVHIVGGNAKKKWILEKMQGHIKAAAPNDVKCDYEYTDAPGHVNIFSPYRLYRKSEHAKDIVFFTHPEDMRQWEAAHECDVAVVMCAKYRDELIVDGMDAAKVHLIHAGVDDIYKDHRLRVLNPSRMDISENYKARKGYDTWQRLCALPWVNCICTGGGMTSEQVHDEYLKADVVVSTATVEGGPMACYEALSMGKVYYGRAGVGLHDETEGVIRYADGDELESMLLEVYADKLRRAQGVENKTWDAWNNQWWKLIGDVAGSTLAAQPYTPQPVAECECDIIPVRRINVVEIVTNCTKDTAKIAKQILNDKGYRVAFTKDADSEGLNLGVKPLQYFAIVRKIDDYIKTYKGNNGNAANRNAHIAKVE